VKRTVYISIITGYAYIINEMEIAMKKIITIILIAFSGFAYSQDIEVKTGSGKIVILHDNGTWEYKIIEKINTENLDINCDYYKNEIDDFTGDEKLWTKSITIGKTKLKHKVKFQLRATKSKSNNVIAISFTGFGDIGCVSSTSTAKLKFSDGEFVELKHFGDTDCGDILAFLTILHSSDARFSELTIDEEDWEKFNTMKIEMIRIQGSKYYTDVIIDDDKQDYILKYLNCVK